MFNLFNLAAIRITNTIKIGDVALILSATSPSKIELPLCLTNRQYLQIYP